MNEKKQGLVGKIVPWVLYALLIAGTIVIFYFWNAIFGEGSVFNNIVNENAVVQGIYSQGIPAALKIICILGIAITIGIGFHYLAKVRKLGNQKLTTVFILLVNLCKWVLVIVTFFFILSACGLQQEFSAAGAGIVALIIGLGSQSLVADILAGMFIVFEGDYKVGDIVILDGWRGEIMAIGVRTTKLIDAGGNIKIVNNSDIRSIINQTQELSVAKCYVGVSYGDRIETIEKVIADNLDKIKEKIPAIVEGPFYKGVSELADSAVVLLFVAKCKENDIYQVQRDLNREIKIVFDDNNVNIPFPQVTVSYDQGNEDTKLSKKDRKVAEAFVEEQKDLSKDIDDKK